MAKRAAAKHERDGFFRLGSCLLDGVGCEKDLNLAKENFLIAAELGHSWAADAYGRLLGNSDPVCWIWFGRAAVLGLPFSFLASFSKQVEEFFSGLRHATCIFLIGRALKGNIDSESRKIFDWPAADFESLIDPSNQAVSFYDSQIKSARLAIDTWVLVSTRLCMIKDMRIYIGKMIWEARFEANYKI